MSTIEPPVTMDEVRQRFGASEQRLQDLLVELQAFKGARETLNEQTLTMHTAGEALRDLREQLLRATDALLTTNTVLAEAVSFLERSEPGHLLGTINALREEVAATSATHVALREQVSVAQQALSHLVQLPTAVAAITAQGVGVVERLAAQKAAIAQLGTQTEQINAAHESQLARLSERLGAFEAASPTKAELEALERSLQARYDAAATELSRATADHARGIMRLTRLAIGLGVIVIAVQLATFLAR